MDRMVERIQENAVWRIEKYDANGELFEVSEFNGNLLLNEGINDIWKKVAGTAGTAFDHDHAYLGVGDSNAAASASQTGLQASSNKLYKAMDAGYPTSGTNQQIVFRATFGSSDANWAWEEFTVANGDSDAGVNLNRKAQSQGTKSSGQTWVLTLTITLS